jgi:ferredoxin
MAEVKRHTLSFKNAPSITVSEGESLSESLDVMNAPILFGCRTGICATCLVRVISGHEALPPLSEEESEVLELETDDPDCRLACQLHLLGDVTLEYVGK